MSAPAPFFTVGHSDRSLESFLGLLRENAVGLVADVRKLPGSRAHPQFDAEPLRAALSEAQIGYRYFAALGGRRGRSKQTPDALNAFWTHRSFHNYADYALTTEFRAALAELRALRERRVAMMCAEAVWWRCHRRIIADYLIVAGEEVIHIMGAGRTEAAKLTVGGEARADGSVIYPPSAPIA